MFRNRLRGGEDVEPVVAPRGNNRQIKRTERFSEKEATPDADGAIHRGVLPITGSIND